MNAIYELIIKASKYCIMAYRATVFTSEAAVLGLSLGFEEEVK